MLNEILFWKNWNKLFKNIYFFLLGLFVCSLVFFLYGLIQVEEISTPWQTVNYIDKKSYSYLDISMGVFNIPLENFTYFITQHYKAAPLQLHINLINIFFTLFVLVFIFLTSIISYFKRWWFYFANTLIILTIVGLRLDLFMVFGDTKNIFTIATLICFVGVGYFFHAIKPQTPFVQRLLVNLFLVTVFAVCLNLGTKLPYPQLYLSNYGLFAPIFICIVFTALVAFDVEYIFLYITTVSKSTNPKNNTFNFIAISVLYLGNLLLTVLKKMNVIDWDLFYLDEYFILFIATIAGFWVYRRRLEATGSVIAFQPFGAMFYVLMATLAWACIGYVQISDNVSLTKALKELILFIHFGFGLSFVIFLLYNYTVYLNQNLPVFAVIFNAEKGPIHYMRIGGLIVSISLITNNYNLAYKYLMAGYYSNIADVYMYEKDYGLATQYYNKVAEYKDYDYKRNMGMANIAENNEDYENALKFYENIHYSFDCKQAYINEAFIYDKQGNFLKSLDVLKEGNKKYPNSPEFFINIGYIFSKTKLYDSSLYYYKLAEKFTESEKMAKTNILGLAISKNINEILDENIENLDYLPYSINYIAVKNIKGEACNLNYKNEVDNDAFWMYHINYQGNKLSKKDTSVLNKNTKILLAQDSLDDHKEDLIYANAIYNFEKSNINKAMTDMYYLKNYYTSESGVYANSLGIISLVQKQPKLAFEYFKESYADRYNVGGLNGLIALTEFKDLIARKDFLDVLINNTDVTVRDFTSEIAKFSNANLTFTNPEDIIKYININKKYISDNDLVGLISKIENPSYRLTASLLVQTELIARKSYSLAETIKLDGMNVAQMSYKANLNQLYILANKGEFEKIWKVIDETKLNKEDEVYRKYFKILAANGLKNFKFVNSHLEELVESLPLYSESVLFAVNYLENSNQKDKAYDLASKCLTINPGNLELKKKTCLLAVYKGLGMYLDKQLEELRLELPSNEYLEFKKKFDLAEQKQNAIF
ncbi:MAG: hypothetical protein U0V72_02900 [Cytophagales bacterium]